MTNFFFKLKKNPTFGPFPNFSFFFWGGGKKCFPKKSGTHKLIKFSSSITKFREICPSFHPTVCWVVFLELDYYPIPRKQPNRQVGWKDEQTQFHGTLPATARDSKSTTAVDWHLKVKDIEYDVGLTKNYCPTVSMKKSTEFVDLLFRYSRF